MNRDQFTFYRSYYEALKHLPKRDQAAVLMAVIGYALDETAPTLSGVPLSVFTLIRPTLDAGRNKARNRLNKMKTNQQQNRKEKEREKEREIEREIEIESEVEREGENDSSLPPVSPSPPLSVVMTAYLDKVNPTPSNTSMEELKGYVEQMGAECCLRAIDIALDERKTTWSYIRAILRSKLSQGVRCLADWDALDAEREEGEKNHGAGSNQTAGEPADGSFHGWRAKSALDEPD